MIKDIKQQQIDNLEVSLIVRDKIIKDRIMFLLSINSELKNGKNK